MRRLGWHLRELTGLVLKTCCPLCQRSANQAFCLDCSRRLHRCQLAPAAQWQPGTLPVFAWGSYSGSLKRAIACLKYENNPQLARPLAHWLAQSWLSHSRPGRLTVVPIPIHVSKRKQRGFNQADLLAESFCEFSRLPLERQGLERSQATTAQFTLSAAEREQNLANAFTPGPAFRKKPPASPVLLLDDIYTTGATARSAAQTLRQHGIRVYGVAVVARTMSYLPNLERS
ncbi:ComF family protein [Leptothermofonsia sichuanensis E412]|uniref:ComF family protein n=1 Tax=Leptothermofonsia sichuanensis TaxID=2917832 RepID=UPI001CA60B60|nr:ComF family protein [Leptothermofonsia sichuanensis]QZZ19949.1 ComF family protein [Leptothermofonsia sichuanensis E412]